MPRGARAATGPVNGGPPTKAPPAMNPYSDSSLLGLQSVPETEELVSKANLLEAEATQARCQRARALLEEHYSAPPRICAPRPWSCASARQPAAHRSRA